VHAVEGAAGLLNGVGEPGGSVNLVRKRPTSEFAGHVTGGVGRWNLELFPCNHHQPDDFQSLPLSSPNTRATNLPQHPPSHSQHLPSAPVDSHLAMSAVEAARNIREDLERLEQGIADRVREEPKHVCAYESPPLLYPRKRSGADH